MKKWLVIVLTCVLLFSAGFLLYSDFGVNHQQEQAGTQSHDTIFTQSDFEGGPWPPPDES
jgi:hypothetical protein